MLSKLKFALTSCCIAAAYAAPLAAQQSPAVSLTSTVMVERTVKDASGQSHTERVLASNVAPGDRLWFNTRFRNDAKQEVRDFVITNPLHSAVRLAPEADPALTVSVDKGKTWGSLGELQVTTPDGSKRPATPTDVTHVRWKLGAIAPGQTGEREFVAVVL